MRFFSHYSFLFLVLSVFCRTANATAWEPVEKLAQEQKFQAALDKTKELLQKGRDQNDEQLITEALLKATQLEMGLHGYETAVRFLKDTPWPKSGAFRVLLHLYYGRSLMNYQQIYSWEINQREQTSSSSIVDLKAWTTQQIGQEISRSFDAALQDGAWLDLPVPAFFRAYLTANTYPDGVRPHLRDALVYLAVGHLENQQFWSSREANEIFKLGAARLAANSPVKRIPAASEQVHPIERAASWLGELEHIHGKQGLPEAALEAHYVLLETLHSAFGEAHDKIAVRESLGAFQKSAVHSSWWSRGQALLATFLREEDWAGRLVAARREAILGRNAFPLSPGGTMCASLIFELERPELNVAAMANDGMSKRSLLLTYRNLRKAYFRAYPVNVEAQLEVSTQGSTLLTLDMQKLRALLASGVAPAASWSANLAETTDFISHRHFVTPPALPPGMYQIVSSIREDFSEAGNVVQAVPVFVSDLVLNTRPSFSGGLEVRAFAGETGRPANNASVTLYRYNYQTPAVPVQTLRVDAKGYAQFPFQEQRNGQYWSFFLLGQQGKNLAFTQNGINFGRPCGEMPVTSAFIYTDRSIYRPQQKIFFKVVAYSGRSSEGRFEVAKAGETLSVRLLDPNYQQVGEQTVKLGAFGSGSGEFLVPSGRPLGQWNIQLAGRTGAATVKVEEYKRPTFETKLMEAGDPLRLNHKARVKGEARYYFGLPVTSGTAQWRVTRTEVSPWWWEFWGWWRGGHQRTAQTVGSGKTEIGKDGSFSFDFLPEADERRKEKKDDGTSYNFEVSVDVTDEGGETRSASRFFRLGFVALEARLNWDEGFFRAGQNSMLRAQLSNLDGKPIKGIGRFRVTRLDSPVTPLPADLPSDENGIQGISRKSEAAAGFQTADDKIRARWETDFRWEAVTRTWKEAEIIIEGKVEHDEKGEGAIPLKGLASAGVYRLTYSTKDAFGANFEVSRDFLVSGPGALNLPVLLVPEFPARKVGETARFLVHSGLKSQNLVFEIFRSGKPMQKKEISSGKGPELIEIPITAADRGGFTAVVSGLRDHQPLRAEAALQVPWSDRALKVEFSTFRDKLKPGEKETFRITVKNEKGNVLEKGGAEVLAYMYDRSLDLFGEHSYPSVMSLYPSRQGAPGENYSLGTAPLWTVVSNLPPGPTFPTFAPDQLQVYANYGIGGPGSRFQRGRFSPMAAMSEGGGMAEDAVMQRSAPGANFASLAPSGASGKMMAKNADGRSGPPPVAAPAAELRTNFSENAFFAPHLVLGEGGSASVEFTAPDSVTSWRVLAHALTKDLRGGSASRETRTVKDLMVRPYAPRFLREGDEAEIKVQVNNAGDNAFSGDLEFDIENTETGKSALGEFGINGGTKKSFSVEKNGSVTLGFPVRAPKKVGDYAFRVTANTKGFSDGERRPFPVLPSRMHLAQSRFTVLHNKDSRILEFADLASGADPTLLNEQMAVTVDAQLFYGVLQALPYLEKYPYECVEQTLNRFLSTGIVSSIFQKYPGVAKMAKDLAGRKTQFERFDDQDPNRRMQLEETPWLQEAQGGKNAENPLLNVLNPEIAKAERDDSLAKLNKMQLSNGAFPWFQGGPPDEHMTLYILMSLTRALEFKVPIPQELVVKAWGYVHGWLEEHLDYMISHDSGWETVSMVNFALSGYPSKEWSGGFFDETYRNKLLDFSYKHWKEHAPLVKGYLALTLKRMGREKDAMLVWASVMDSAKHDDQLGTYWAREDRSWLWYNDEIETHAFALRTQMELAREDKHNEGMVQWLFLNKKLNHWKSTRATAEVIYALTHYLDATSQLGTREAVKVDLGGQITEFQFDPEKYTGKKNQVVIPGEKIDSKTMSRITVSKTTPGFAFASATWQFSTDKLPEEDRGDFFQVSRAYFRREHAGNEWRLVPLSEGAKIAVGDEVEVQLSLRAKHAAEYVHLRDPRGAGFEPENQNSGWKWNNGIAWYEETRDSGSNFFFSSLPVGEFTFKYRVRANMAGNFRVGPATVQSMYAPEFNAYSAGHMLKVDSKRE